MKRLKALLSPRCHFRSAITGEFVSKLYALAHPLTTVAERVTMQDSGDMR